MGGSSDISRLSERHIGRAFGVLSLKL